MSAAYRKQLAEGDAVPLVMGILNVTPDSFSDGGDFLSEGAAFDRAAEMVEEGVDIIDIGAESTRPGAEPIPPEEQISRVGPLIQRIAKEFPRVGVSIDTRSAAVAREAIDAGATMVNDVSALRGDPDLAPLIAERGADVVLMHMAGDPATMQAGGGPEYDDVVEEVRGFFAKRVAAAEKAGIERARVLVDPGIGFGKKVEDNLKLLAATAELKSLGFPILIGASRKRFIGAVLTLDEPKARDDASLGCAVWCALGGARVIRTHSVRPTRQALRIVAAIRSAPSG